MPKRILLFSDGTGNSSAKAQKTNVWRLFQAVDLIDSNQIAHYDDGVGTSSNKYLAMLGGAFGWGLKRNVIDLYKFACRNYRPGDEISGFGFSRGAFTIRVLVGLIAHEGLLYPMTEEELDRYARAAYRSYRSKRFPSCSPIVIALRWLRDACLHGLDLVRGLPPYTADKNRTNVPIRFLGLWDTVAAYEIPINALKKAVNAVLWPMLFADLKLAPNVTRACHALSLDDARLTFHPLLWDENGEAELVENNEVRAGRLTQVWFPGVHSNVGGGYPEDRLSYLSLHWIMSEAAAAGVELLPAAVEKVAAEKSPYARIYDSRAGFAAFYRYAPRHLPVWLDARRRRIDPVVDSSVILRMADGTDSYAPVPLRGRFWVLEPQGTFRPMTTAADMLPENTAAPTSMPVPLIARSELLKAHTAQLTIACERFELPNVTVPDPQALQVVEDTVWWGRVVYLFQLAFAFLLAAFPAYDTATPLCSGDTCNRVATDAVLITDDVVRYVIDAVKGMLPSISTRWTDAFGAHPHLFALLAAGLFASLYQSGILKMRIADRARMAWHADFHSRYLAWSLRSARGSRNVTVVALAVALGLLLTSAWRHPEEKIPESCAFGGCTIVASPTTIELAVATLALTTLLGWRVYRLRVLERTTAAQSAPLPTTFALRFARWLRTNSVLLNWYRCVANRVIPATVIVLFVALAAMTINRAVFDAALAIGTYCRPLMSDKPRAPSVFRTSDFCWPSGIQVEKDASYLITLTTDGDWFDASERADVGGFHTDTLVHFSAMLLRRHWFEPWFKPIARIGNDGNDEYVLDPVHPFAAHRYQNGMSAVEPKTLPISAAEAENGMRKDPTPTDRNMLVAQITARRTGELFLYVNDAVLAPPFDPHQFYRNNHGSAVVRIDRLCPDGRVRPIERNKTGGGTSSNGDAQGNPDACANGE